MKFEYQHTRKKPSSAPSVPTIYLIETDEYMFCPIRKKAYKVNSKPEEKVRQYWLYRLRDQYGYPFKSMDVEVSILMGSTHAKKTADIVVYNTDNTNLKRIFVEVKKPKRYDGLEQLKAYMNATGCRIGLWSNGEDPPVYLLRNEPTATHEEAEWRELRNIPKRHEKLADVDTPILRKELEPVNDFLSIVNECDNYIRAHEGTNVFDEIFKLIFTKLYDERINLKNESSAAAFRVGVFEAPEEARSRISELFEEAKKRWFGVFDESETIKLTNISLAFCVSALQKTYLFKSRADVLGSAFEVMINPDMKGDKGQYFTPRHLIQMCVEILDPKDGETIFDPACGSGGFLIGAIEHVFAKIEADRDDENEIIENKKDYASLYVYGIDFDRMIAKVAKAYMLIWGDGRSNIEVADALNEDNWNDTVAAKFLSGEGKEKNPHKFDIILTNPPFAGDISAEDTLSRYEIAYKPSKGGKRSRLKQVSRDKLFLERCISMLKEGGRLGIVVPRGILKNYHDEYIRRYIVQHCMVRGVVSVTSNMFKPFTNTKTCVIFLQKRLSPLNDFSEARNDPAVAYAVAERPGKDRSGKIVHDAAGNVDSDLPDIVELFRNNVKF
jgi:type I restriction enzyme M protein